jgi:hypothetical protein
VSTKPTSPFAGLDKFLLRNTRDEREADQLAATPPDGVAQPHDQQPVSTSPPASLPAGPMEPIQAPAQASVDTRKHANKQTRLHVMPGSPQPQRSTTKVSTEHPEGLELLKYSVYFTQADLDDIEDLKIALRRKNGITCTKYNIVRQAFLDLLEDYNTHGDDSRLVRRLRNESR